MTRKEREAPDRSKHHPFATALFVHWYQRRMEGAADVLNMTCDIERLLEDVSADNWATKDELIGFWVAVFTGEANKSDFAYQLLVHECSGFYPHREGKGEKHCLYVPLNECGPVMSERTEEYATLLKVVVEDAKAMFETTMMEIFGKGAAE